ncbi:hypothetical protein IE53DRAFT_369067 [Violaceomyces palustris]|uniref:Uncharacterized protein n=1 Tax=Violaceomyces palustris TaxID=1673888 RepID=A0ACD0NWY4_9BASI|nr:hypothetical protein IE53DRAFT_369067 [Violaceomyces palustris]
MRSLKKENQVQIQGSKPPPKSEFRRKPSTKATEDRSQKVDSPSMSLPKLDNGLGSRVSSLEEVGLKNGRRRSRTEGVDVVKERKEEEEPEQAPNGKRKKANRFGSKCTGGGKKLTRMTNTATLEEDSGVEGAIGKGEGSEVGKMEGEGGKVSIPKPDSFSRIRILSESVAGEVPPQQVGSGGCGKGGRIPIEERHERKRGPEAGIFVKDFSDDQDQGSKDGEMGGRQTYVMDGFEVESRDGNGRSQDLEPLQDEDLCSDEDESDPCVDPDDDDDYVDEGNGEADDELEEEFLDDATEEEELD